MKKVVIVDDEKIVRIGLKSIMDWHVLGFAIVGEARNGKEALELIEKHNPDIVITDLRMPVLDGIGLIEAINRAKYDIKVLVLSNYDDFDLVKRAMKLGVFDYLLKISLNSEQLNKILIAISNEIDLDRSRREEVLEEKQRLEEMNHIAIHNFIKEILTTPIDKSLLANQIRKLDLQRIVQDNKILIYIYLYENKERVISDERRYIYSVKNVINEITKDSIDTEVIALGKREYLIFKATEELIVEEKIYLLCTKIKDTMKMYLDANVTIIIGNIFTDFERMNTYIHRFRNRLFYSEENTILTLNHIDYLQKVSLNNTILNNVKESIESGDKESLLKSIDRVFHKSISEQWHPKVTADIINLCLGVMEQVLLQWGINEVEIMKSYRLDLTQGITYVEYKQLIIKIIEDGFDRLNGIKKNKYKTEVIDVIEYLNKNAYKKISLSEIARLVNLNESYLCRTFKKETGQGITEYINNLKIDKAKEILKSSDILVKEVSIQIGIDNPYYFNRLFKKIVGITPGEYQKKINAK